MSTRLDRRGYELEFCDDFPGDELDRTRWIPYYLPQWSSREASAARFDVADGRLRLRIDRDQPAWAPHLDGHLRVSNLQTGVHSGPVGSGIGQHPFRPDLVVHEQQPSEWLYTPHHGLVEVRLKATADPRAMAALWLIGTERTPHQSAEICLVEIFGRDVRPESVQIGMGIHPFGDPGLTDDFRKVTVPIDAREFHDYAVEWGPGFTRFHVDGEVVQQGDQSPDYPMQLMLDIYEFAEDETRRGDYPIELIVDSVRGYRRR